MRWQCESKVIRQADIWVVWVLVAVAIVRQAIIRQVRHGDGVGSCLGRAA